jgi:hypothetical protein
VFQVSSGELYCVLAFIKGFIHQKKKNKVERLQGWKTRQNTVEFWHNLPKHGSKWHVFNQEI